MKVPPLTHRGKLKHLTADVWNYALAGQAKREALAAEIARDERNEWTLLTLLLTLLVVAATC